MKRLIFLLLNLTIVIIHFSSAKAQLTFERASSRQTTISNFSSMTLCFTENRGQWDSEALYKANAGGATFFFCQDEAAYIFIRDTHELKKTPYSEISAMHGISEIFKRPQYKKETLIVKAKFVGANPESEVRGIERISHNNNYFIGNDPTKWATDVPNYSSITYKDIYPGIDLTYHGDGRGMKYDFIVSPGADLSVIKIRYEGVEILSISNMGDLEAMTSFGTINERIPTIYQEINGERYSVSGRYNLISSNTFGFTVDDGYNPAYPLVIDPELVYSTYIGGSNYDQLNRMAVDWAGCAYVTGLTMSVNFPIVNPYQQNQPMDDIFVAKLCPTGDTLIYATYLGGNNDDWGIGIAVDTNCCAYITGYTGSTNYPLQNPFQQVQPYWNSLVTKLSPQGDSLIYSTYLGGHLSDSGDYIVVDRDGCAYVTGWTWSDDFPTLNPYQTFQGPIDVFVTKFTPNGDSIAYSTFLGGSDSECGYSIAVDEKGCAYVTGETYSSNFPLVNPYQNDSPDDDAFIAKLSPIGNNLIYSSYLGGSNIDWGSGIALDDGENAYVTGATQSNNFPVVNPFQSFQGIADAFVSKFALHGDSLVYSTFLGGSDSDCGYSIAVDEIGCAYIAGWTASSNFPVLRQFQRNQPEGDAFLTKLGESGNSLVYSTYLGGGGDDAAWQVVLDRDDNTFVAGTTDSRNFPTLHPYQTDQDTVDGFISKFGSYPDAIDDEISLPKSPLLLSSYPNPFNARTIIRYDLPMASDVTLNIFDILGRKIETLVESAQSAGHYEVIWNANDQASGVYFCRIKAGGTVKTQKMLLVR